MPKASEIREKISEESKTKEMASPRRKRDVNPYGLVGYFPKILKEVNPDARGPSKGAKAELQEMIFALTSRIASGAVSVARNREQGKTATKTQKSGRIGTLLTRDAQTAVSLIIDGQLGTGADKAGRDAVDNLANGAGGAVKRVTIKKGEHAGETRASPVRREDLAKVTIPISRIENIVRNITGEGKTATIRVKGTAPVYIAGVIDYVVRELLMASDKAAAERKVKTVGSFDVAKAVKHDEELLPLFGNWFANSGEKIIMDKMSGKSKKKRGPRKGKKAARSPRSRAAEEPEESAGEEE
jgi:histone H3/H4